VHETSCSNPRERRGNAGPWKTRKTKTRFPFVSPRPWKSLRDSHIPTAPMMSPLSAPTNPKKGAPNRAYLSSPLQAHSWIRKCWQQGEAVARIIEGQRHTFEAGEFDKRLRALEQGGQEIPLKPMEPIPDKDDEDP